MITALRDAAHAAPKDGEAWFAYGLFLTVNASDRLGDWHGRFEAQQALEPALRLLPRDDPRPLAAFAVLRRKQAASTDAHRAVGRALGRMTSGNGALDACFQAEVYYQMAMIYRASWEDWDGMTFIGGPVTSLVPCAPRQGRTPTTCPEQYYDAMSRRGDLSRMRFKDRDATIETLEAAIAANPRHRDAEHALLLALFDLGDWKRFTHVLRSARALDSLDAWLDLWEATEAYTRRDLARAERAARDGLRRLSPTEREALLSPLRIIPPHMGASWDARDDSLYWRAADPLFLTDVNERLLAHVTRVTYAAAKYDVPLMGVSGLDTDPAFLFVRYGRPWRRWMFGGARRRQVIWAVDSTTTPFRLEKKITLQRWRFPKESEAYTRTYAERMPERWNPREAFDAFDSLPAEVARFEDDGHTVLDVYALWRNPYTDVTPDSVRIGFFINDVAMHPLLDRRRLVTRPGSHIRLQFRAPLGPASYRYRVETLTGPKRAAGVMRGALRVTAPAPDSLRTSDLLLGRAAREGLRTIPHRDSLHIDPLYDLQMSSGDSLVVYWETYGLTPDSADIVHYHVTAEARGPDPSALAQVSARLRSGRDVRHRSGVTVEWDVDAAAADGVRRDVLVMDPAGWRPGTYVLRVRIAERGSGRTAASERNVVVRRSEP